MLRIFPFIACFAGACASLPAQTIHDVITSLSDRQRILVQREQVRAQLQNEYADGVPYLPDDSPINWIGVGADPSEPAINAQGVAARVALVNQAVAEFDRIAPSYANVSVGELEGAGPAGTIDFFRAGDFPPLPRATPENHQEILRQLAQRVRALRVVLWPSAFERTTFTGSGDALERIECHQGYNPTKVLDEEGMSPFSWQPSALGASNIDGEESATSFLVSESDGSTMTVSGTYEEQASLDKRIPGPLKEQAVSFLMIYPKRAIVRATAQGAQGLQIGGTVRILSRSRWHQLSVADAPSRFNPANGAFVIEGGGASGDVGLFGSPPATSISGSWVTTDSGETMDGPWHVEKFVETGYQLKAASMLDPSAPGYSDAYYRAYEKNWSVGCRFFSLFQPDFTRGVDAAAARARLDQVNRVLADNTVDGALLLHPRPSLLFGIDLGPGLNGAGGGMLSAGSMPDALENSHGVSRTSSTYGIVSGIAPVRRFDSTYALRLAGSANDYHVVYENNRPGRSQSLPQLAWPYDYNYAPDGTAYDCETLYRDWDRPRLRQVVGRDLIASVTYNPSHYGGYTITVYRRPGDASAPVAGQAVGTDNLPVVRTWTFTKPGAGTTAHPTDPEQLQVDGNANEKFEIAATHSLPNNGAGWDAWYDYHYALWGGTWTTAWWWYSEGNRKWVLKLSRGQQEKWRKEIGIDTTNLSPDPWGQDFEHAVKVGTFLDGQPVGELSSGTLDPFGDASPSDWSYAAAGKTIVGTPVPGDAGNPAFRYGKLAATLGIDFDGVKPDMDAEWNEQGMLAALAEGAWAVSGEADGTAWKITRKFNNQTIATDWFEFTGPASLKHYSAPDGSAVTKGHSSVAAAELEMGTLSTGMPGMPHKVTRSDGTGATFAWTIGTDGAGTLVATDGLMSDGSITKGTSTTLNFNAAGYPVESVTIDVDSGLQLAGTTGIDFTDWGAPLSTGDYTTGLLTSWTYDNNLSRLASVTSPLGLTTEFSAFDALGRPGQVAANGITATNTFTGPGVSTDYSGTDVQAGTQSSTTRDALGRLLSSSSTWNGVVDNLGLSHGASVLEVSRTAGPYGTHTARIRQADGTLASASGPTLPFGGLGGNGLSVSNGLLVTRAEILDGQGQGTGTFAETHTDAWGRVRKVVTPSKSNSGSVETSVAHSNPDSTLRRVITTGPSGRVLITESNPCDASGAVSRSGIDIDENGSLGAADRYTESVTTVDGTKVVTTLSVTENAGLREILRTEWTPSTGITVTKVNGNEETITTAPDYGNKSVTATSSKGWTRTTALNSLGLPTGNTLSGTGIPTTGLDPDWRADGSLASVGLTIGGESHTATFNPDGTLASLTVPGKGNILGGHTIANGVETLTVDGVTRTARLDGTQAATSGADIIGKTETIAPSGGGYRNTVHPATGADTTTDFSAAGAPTGKNYAAGEGESYGYENELLASVTLARGGSVGLEYSDDGAKDLVSIAWPAVSSGDLAVPAVTHGFGYDRAGRVESLADPSGARTLGYQNGRPASELWTAGPLKGYEVIRHIDGTGRDTGFTLKRDGAVIHSAAKAPNGASDQITNLASGNLTATPQRDAAGRITGYVWSDGTNTVTQTWQRGTGGRIEAAGSDVQGAPSFDYLIDPGNPGESFDARGRRLKCATAGGTWTYTYTNGQLVSATHASLGTFAYQFDGIGRRTDKGTANTTDLLNRTVAWTHSQNKTVKVTARPDARLWFNGVEVQNFNGSHTAAITPPGPDGGWVEWHALAILDDQGEGAGDPPPNALASPDAKAEQRGAVWVPPISETFAFDAAGNRQSSAQWDYGWDAKNQLVRARTKGHATAARGWDITFGYDAEGRRYRKHVVELREGARVSEKEITYVWDGWDIIYERHQLPGGLTTLERRYLWGPDIADGAAGGAGGLLLIRETRGNTTIDMVPLGDGTGHVVALTNLNKDLLASYAYGPFGEPVHATGPAAQANPWRWASKYLDDETGLYYFGLRYYDPVTGQWLSREPMGEGESVNLYSYCHNDPVNRVDVLGMSEASFNEEMLLLATPEFQQLFAVEPTNWETWRLWFKGTVGKLADRHLDPDEKYTVLEATARCYQRLFEGSLERKRDDSNLYRPINGARERERRQKERAVEIGWAMLDAPFHLGAAAFSGLLGTDITTGTTITWNSWANGGGLGLAEVSPGERAFAAAMVFLPIGRVENVADDVARVGLRTERGLAGGLAKPWVESAAKGGDEVITLWKGPGRTVGDSWGGKGILRSRDPAAEAVRGFLPGDYPGKGPFFGVGDAGRDGAIGWANYWKNGLQEFPVLRTEYDGLLRRGIIQIDDLETFPSIRVAPEGLDDFNSMLLNGPANTYHPPGSF